MKAIYEKPQLTVVDFEMNSSIANCTVLQPDAPDTDIGSCPVSYPPGFGANEFAADTSCSTVIDGYCYFTSNSGDSSSMVANS